jgi:(p)ppGpp synthase/HD superfamily hydrolase
MIYTTSTKKAMSICYRAHKGQVDKAGLPYVFHPFHLAEQMQEEDEIIVALLHDVVEDSDYDFNNLKSAGFSNEIIEALKLLTHKKSVPYMKYIEQIKCNALATKIKLADLKHNSDLSRLDTVDSKALERVEKYAKAIKFLSQTEGPHM